MKILILVGLVLIWVGGIEAKASPEKTIILNATPIVSCIRLMLDPSQPRILFMPNQDLMDVIDLIQGSNYGTDNLEDRYPGLSANQYKRVASASIKYYSAFVKVGIKKLKGEYRTVNAFISSVRIECLLAFKKGTKPL